MRILWVYQLLLVGEFLLVPYVHAAHGDNMLCEGCGTVMEHVYHDVVKYSEEVGKSIDMTQGETLTVDFSDRVKKVCDQDEFLSHYNRNVRSACWEMCHKFPNVLSNVFGGDEPTERAVYKITYKACVDVLDYCDKIDGSYTDKLFRSKSSQASLPSVKCNRCRTVVSDMVNVVERKKFLGFFPYERTYLQCFRFYLQRNCLPLPRKVDESIKRDVLGHYRESRTRNSKNFD